MGSEMLLVSVLLLVVGIETILEDIATSKHSEFGFPVRRSMSTLLNISKLAYLIFILYIF